MVVEKIIISNKNRAQGREDEQIEIKREDFEKEARKHDIPPNHIVDFYTCPLFNSEFLIEGESIVQQTVHVNEDNDDEV